MDILGALPVTDVASEAFNDYPASDLLHTGHIPASKGMHMHEIEGIPSTSESAGQAVGTGESHSSDGDHSGATGVISPYNMSAHTDLIDKGERNAEHVGEVASAPALQHTSTKQLLEPDNVVGDLHVEAIQSNDGDEINEVQGSHALSATLQQGLENAIHMEIEKNDGSTRALPGSAPIDGNGSEEDKAGSKQQNDVDSFSINPTHGQDDDQENGIDRDTLLHHTLVPPSIASAMDEAHAFQIGTDALWAELDRQLEAECATVLLHYMDDPSDFTINATVRAGTVGNM